MPTTYKVLGQVLPSANTITTIYTVPAATQTVVSSISICAVGQSTTYRIQIKVNNETSNNKQFIVYDAPVNQYDTVFLTLGITLSAGDVVQVQAGNANVAFNLFGSEIT